MTTESNSRSTLAVVSALLAAAVMAVPAPAAAQAAGADEVTYSRDIAPILQRSCQKCHRPEALAPCRC